MNHVERPGCCADGTCTAETCMVLSAGQTCRTCAHHRLCELFGYAGGSDCTVCNFYPRRFRSAYRGAPQEKT